MTPLSLIEALKKRGCTVKLEGGNIRVQGFLDDALRREIREHKSELLSILTGESDLDTREKDTQAWRSLEVDKLLLRGLKEMGIEFGLEDGKLKHSYIEDRYLYSFVAARRERLEAYLKCTGGNGGSSVV